MGLSEEEIEYIVKEYINENIGDYTSLSYNVKNGRILFLCVYNSGVKDINNSMAGVIPENIITQYQREKNLKKLGI